MGRIGSRTPAALRRDQQVVLLGVDLTDAREEIFVRMVCDGLALGIAFTKAGFTSASDKGRHVAAHNLFHLPRVQQRAAAILEARRTQGVVTLPEVTDMLQRVFAKALHDDQLNAAHNAAFSLARLYGHVTDRAVVDVLRKPSRDPDAPAERSLTNWIDALPVKGPSPEGPQSDVQEGLEKAGSASPRPAIEGPSPGATYTRLSPEGSSPDVVSGQQAKPLISQGSGLGDGPRQSGNGAPVRPVTGTPNRRGRSAVLTNVSRETNRVHSGGKPKKLPKNSKVPVLSGAMKRKKRRMKDLFG